MGCARGAQDTRDLLRADVDTFQRIVDYHAAQLSVGAIAEQDVLRTRLEGERLAIAANLAALAALHAPKGSNCRKRIGDADYGDVVLTDALDVRDATVAQVPFEKVLKKQRPSVTAARAALVEAKARARVQDVAARPNSVALLGYKTHAPARSPGWREYRPSRG